MIAKVVNLMQSKRECSICDEQLFENTDYIEIHNSPSNKALFLHIGCGMDVAGSMIILGDSYPNLSLWDKLMKS